METLTTQGNSPSAAAAKREEERVRNRGGEKKKEWEGAATRTPPRRRPVPLHRCCSSARHGLDRSLHRIAAAPSTPTSSPTGERRRLASPAFPCSGALQPPLSRQLRSPRSLVPLVVRLQEPSPLRRRSPQPPLPLPCPSAAVPSARPRRGSGEPDARVHLHSHSQAAKATPLLALVGPSLIRTAGEPRCRPFSAVPAVEFRHGLAMLELPACAFLAQGRAFACLVVENENPPLPHQTAMAAPLPRRRADTRNLPGPPFVPSSNAHVRARAKGEAFARPGAGSAAV